MLNLLTAMTCCIVPCSYSLRITIDEVTRTFWQPLLHKSRQWNLFYRIEIYCLNLHEIALYEKLIIMLLNIGQTVVSSDCKVADV